MKLKKKSGPEGPKSANGQGYITAVDPGFPRHPQPQEGQPAIWSNFTENCMKLDQERVKRASKILLRRSATA